MARVRQILLLVVLTVLVLGLSNSFSLDRPACGQQIGAMGIKAFDAGTGECVDGTGTCFGRVPR
jgi:hypothetical protein